MGDFQTAEGRRSAAMLAGLLYLGVITGGIFAEAVVRQGVFAPSNPGATAAAILESETLYRAGFGVSLVFLAFNLPILLVFYRFLRSVNLSYSLLMVFFFLVATSVETMNVINHLSALRLVLEVQTVQGVDPNSAAFLAYMALDEFNTGFGVSLVYFGIYFVMLGYLLSTSRFLPRTIGIFLIIAGICYVTNSFVLFLAPSYSSYLFPYILLPSLVAELSTALWLLFKGIDENQWNDWQLARQS